MYTTTGEKRTGRNYIMCKEGLLLYDIILKNNSQ